MGAGAIALGLGLGFGLGACAQSNTPDEYGTVTEQSFLETCTNFYFDNTDDTLSITDNTITETSVEPPTEDACRCMYEIFTGPSGTGDGTDGGMPINSDVAKTVGWTGPNFTDLNSDLKNDPQTAWNELPEEYKTSITDCQSGGGAGESTTTSTTAAPAEESTTTTAAG